MPHHTANRRAASGFTMVELMVTIAVAAILMAIAFPSFQSVMRSNRLATATNQVIGAVSLARTEAIRNTRGAGVCASSDGSTCAVSTDWATGWLVWSDLDGNGTYDGSPTDTALRFMKGDAKTVVTGPSAATAIRFDARGRLAGAQQTIVLQPVTCGTQALRRTLTVAVSGQVRKTGALATCL